jgi:phage FluMu protein Com
MNRSGRCPECGRLLFKTDLSAGTIQTFCKDCRAVRTVHLDQKVITPQTTR